MEENPYKEICGACGCTYGAHLANSYYSEHYKQFFPKDSCPGEEGRMDWDKGHGNTFVPTGTYQEVQP